MNIIEVQGLEKHFQVKTKQAGLKGSFKSMMKPEYKKIHAVNSIDFSVKEGEILAFIGPNGAGKSTTIKMLTGILKPSAGDIQVLGLDPMKQRQQLAFQIGTVFGQKSQLWFHLPALDSLQLLGKIYELDNHQLKKRIDFLSEVFEIEDLLTTPVRKLSLGQRMRCEIAASMLHAPKIIFLDEPTIGLDVVVKQKIRELIKRVNQEEKTTIFLTSHDAGDIEELCQRVMIINHGEIVTDGTVQNLKSDMLYKKLIKLQYKEKVQVNHSEVQILKGYGHEIEVEINTAQMSMEPILSYLLSLGTVMDLTIEDPPLEEIISEIYQRQRGSEVVVSEAFG